MLTRSGRQQPARSRKKTLSRELGDEEVSQILQTSQNSATDSGDIAYPAIPSDNEADEDQEGEEKPNYSDLRENIVQSSEDEESREESGSVSDESEDDIDKMLDNIQLLNMEADRTINSFLNTFNNQKDFISGMRNDSSSPSRSLKPSSKRFYDIVSIYTDNRFINAASLEKKLQISKALDIIFQKANIAIVTVHIATPPAEVNVNNYFNHGGWPEDFAANKGFDHMDDYDNMSFIKAWRTQIYIMGMSMERSPDGISEWPHRCLLGLFCDDNDVSQFSSSDLIDGFESKLKDATMKGWRSNGLPAPEEFEMDLKAHVRKLKDYTEYAADGTPIVDVERLQNDFPYGDFLVKFHGWLKRARKTIMDTKPSPDEITKVVTNCAGDNASMRQKLKELLEDQPKFEAQPVHNRRHTDTFDQGLRKVKPAASTSRKSVKLEGIQAPRGKIMGVIDSMFKKELSGSGLKPPSNSRALSKPSSSFSRPPKIPETSGDSPVNESFDIIGSINDSNKNDDKENLIVSVTTSKSAKVPKSFNQRQDGATKVSWGDDDMELQGSPIARQGHSRRGGSSTASANLLEDDIIMLNVDADDDDVEDTLIETPSSSSKAQQKKKAKARPEHMEEAGDNDEDDYQALPKSSGQRSKAHRHPSISQAVKRKFEGNATAAYPTARRPQMAAASEADSSESSDSGSASTGPPMRAPSRYQGGRQKRIRREWTEEEVKKLQNGVKKFGTKWALIRDTVFARIWSDVDCKDKARNMKLQYLRSLEELPPGFEKVTLGATYIAQLERQGILYSNGDRRATSI